MPLVMPDLSKWVIKETKQPQTGKEFVLITNLKESGNTHELRPAEQYRRELENGEPFPIDLIIEDGTVRKRTTDDPGPFNDAEEVKGLEDLFMITRNGDLYSKRTERVASQTLNQNGYMYHVTKIGGRQGTNRAIRINREVAIAFNLNPENKPIVNHLNGVKADNRDTNLDWVTHQENVIHALETGLTPILHGTEVSNARFTAEQVREIRQLKGTMGLREIGRQYDCHHSLISDIVNGRSYQNVE